MLNFKKNLKKNENAGGTNTNVSANRNAGDLRQRLLQKEFDSLKQLPVGCQIQFDNPDVLHLFKLKINPDKDSLWYGGRFEFTISVPEGYNFEVSYDLF
jgi:ubiquitin-protein ligase